VLVGAEEAAELIMEFLVKSPQVVEEEVEAVAD
jgi:hypothetical protein